MRRWIGGFTGLVAAITVLVAIAQLRQDQLNQAAQNASQATENASQATQIFIFQQILENQQELTELQKDTPSSGLEATQNAERQIELEATNAELARLEATNAQLATQQFILATQTPSYFAGCACANGNCSGQYVSAGAVVPASSILEPPAGQRGTLYIYVISALAKVDGIVWTYVANNDSPANRACLESQTQFFSFNKLEWID